MTQQAYELTEAIKNNQLRGKGLGQKFGVETKQVLKSTDEVTLDEVKQLYTYLLKQQDKYEPRKRLEKGSLTKETIDFISNGGSSALAFCRNVLREEGILKSYTQEITQEDLNKEDIPVGINVQIVKQSNDEQRLATFVVLEPQDDDYMTSDLHGDWYSEEEVAKSCLNFNRYCRKANLLHLMPTTVYEFVESYIAPVEMVLGERYIKKGTWLATIYVDESELGQEIWDGIKSGYFNGLSIQCLAQTESIGE